MEGSSLEELIELKGINPHSELADTLRRKCSFLVSISKLDFEFLLDSLNNSNSLGNSKNKKEDKQEYFKSERDLLRYGKAIGYVIKKAPELEATMLVANVDHCEEKGQEFFYAPSSLDQEIAKARKFGFYLKNFF